jgi:glutamyl-tRNA synthetase
MQQVKSIIAEVEDFSEKNLQKKVKGWITEQGIGFGKVMQPLRLSLVGAMKGPDLFHIMASIGKEETLKRLDFAVEKLG